MIVRLVGDKIIIEVNMKIVSHWLCHKQIPHASNIKNTKLNHNHVIRIGI
jgi:hypothetical protein